MLVVSYAECAQRHVAWEWTVSGNSLKLPQIIIKKATSADCMTVVRFKQRKVVRRHMVEDITCFCLGFLVRRLLLRSLNPVYIHYWLPEEVGIKLVIVMHMGWQLVLHELHNHTSCHFFEAQSERWNRFTQLLCSPPSAPHVHAFSLCPRFPPCMTRGTKPGYKTSFPPSLPSHPSHFLYILQKPSSFLCPPRYFSPWVPPQTIEMPRDWLLSITQPSWEMTRVHVRLYWGTEQSWASKTRAGGRSCIRWEELL